MKNNRNPDPVLITDAALSQEEQLRRREVRYLIMMSTRGLCLALGIALMLIRPPLLGLWLVLCVVGMVLLPWLAVILANDRPAKTRAERRHGRQAEHSPPALPAPSDQRVIDHE